MRGFECFSGGLEHGELGFNGRQLALPGAVDKFQRTQLIRFDLCLFEKTRQTFLATECGDVFIVLLGGCFVLYKCGLECGDFTLELRMAFTRQARQAEHQTTKAKRRFHVRVQEMIPAGGDLRDLILNGLLRNFLAIRQTHPSIDV